MVITLSEEDIAPVLSYVTAMRRDKENNGVPDRMFDIHNTSRGIDIIGKLGEVVISKILNLPVDFHIKTRGDEGLDFILNDTTIQVKTSTHKSLIFNSLGQFKSDVAILVQYVGNDKTHAELDPRFRILGWIDKQSFIDNHYRKNYGYGNRYVVDADILRPLSEMSEKQEPPIRRTNAIL